MGRHESLRLGGDGSEDTLLLETLTVGATPIIGCFEPRAANLDMDQHVVRPHCYFLDVPCAVCSIDTRWPFSALVPADSGTPYAVAGHLLDLAGRENTCREEDTSLDVDGVARAEVGVE